ncbi:MAG TPA: class I tRNA ligase family protein [Isosphaeraceae bacterium]|jgi:methionyl-tRNA synthetase|nr:class I tRNA ligase family protein [Isosphaeraceae bacterium]
MRDPKAFYLTTAIDYPNNRPHIGTAFEKIGADVQVRFRRMEGLRAHFLMGNDENTIKVSQRAEELGVEPQPYVHDMARQFQEVWRALEISFDEFIQTSEPRHHIGCQKFIQAVYDAGDIYKKAYTGLYCTGCEAFKTEKEVVDGRCPNHPNVPLRKVEEENYFFRLSSFGDRLLKHYDEHPDFIQPESRRNEMLSLVQTGLQDVSITRKGFTWGIRVPFDPEQTIYVWFDALLNYITGIGYGTDEERFRSLWPADVHVIGKDITRFHCALWPAMLMSAGLPLPRQVFAHGFVYNKGAKISKSAGTAIDPMDVLRAHGADPFRYYFMRECPFGGDGNYSDERFAEVYNSDLANNLGNLYSRTLSMCAKYFDGRLEGSSTIDPTAWRGGLDLAALVADLRSSIGSFQYNVALQRIWLEVLDAANRYIDATAPFKLARTDLAACKAVLVNLAEALRVSAIFIKPFLPQTAETFYRAFNFEESRAWSQVSYNDAVSRPTGPDLIMTAPLTGGKPTPLFPKIETKAADT